VTFSEKTCKFTRMFVLHILVHKLAVLHQLVSDRSQLYDIETKTKQLLV